MTTLPALEPFVTMSDIAFKRYCLEGARTVLLARQAELHRFRTRGYPDNIIRMQERRVCAALDEVWIAQGRVPPHLR